MEFIAFSGASAVLLYLQRNRGKTPQGVSHRARCSEAIEKPLTKLPPTPILRARKNLSFVSGEYCPRQSVTVRVPATSANLGSGFDCVGMSVDMWNELTLSRSSKFEVYIEGEGATEIPRDETNLAVIAVEAAFRHAGIEMPPLRYDLVQRIPHARGLGSSSAAIVAGLLAGLALAGHKLDITGREELLQLATEIEGHPDNVAPAIYGGIQMGIFSEFENRWMTSRLSPPHGLIFVLFIPDFTGKTEELRKVVPKEIPLKDAVFNMGRLAWLTLTLAKGDTESIKQHLREGFQDRLHQPQRAAAVYKHLYPLMEAAYGAGAVGAYLSGAGPVIMAWTMGGSGDFFTQRDAGVRTDTAVANAMRAAALKHNIAGKVYITHPTSTGGVVVRADPPYSNSLVTYNGRT